MSRVRGISLYSSSEGQSLIGIYLATSFRQSEITAGANSKHN